MKDLTHYRWQQIDTLFGQALEQPPEYRTSFILEACGTDTELRNHVEKLLELHEESGGILDESVGSIAAPLIPELMEQIEVEPSSTQGPGSMIGPYEIIKEIGCGGMGTVYLARKIDDQYGVQVAVKLVRRGMDTQDVLRRFHHEGQILAALKHPNIARLYDGGVHDDGRPWFAMEYIQGEPIHEYCDRHQLTVEERLKLFITVCEAVQHAHQNLIIHRDLKPAHVLVTARREVKLVDFGIAKLLEPDRMELTDFHTREGVKVMTPEFAAPEQVRGEVVNTASDIYSLGVLLYLLLTGRHPYRVESSSMSEVERIVCETDPAKPSHAVRGDSLPAGHGVSEKTFDAEASAALRKKSVSDLKRMLSGDLDHIVLKALRKETEQRYQSVLGLVDDLGNYLNGQPVTSRAPTIRYRVHKFMHRNKWVVATVAVAIVSILSGLGVALWQAHVAEQERDMARIEAAKAQAAQEYLVGLFESADPAQTQGEVLTAQKIVQRGIDRLGEDLESQPEVHVEMLKVLGRIQQALGDFNLSTRLLEQALNKTRELRSEEHPDIAEVAAMLGETAHWNGELERAETLLRQALTMRKRFIHDDDPAIANNMVRLARTLEIRGDFGEAENLYREALAMRERLFGENSEAVLANLNDLGWLLHQMGKWDEAEELLRRSLIVAERVLESPHPLIATAMNHLAAVLRVTGRYDESEHVYMQSLKQQRNLYGDDHPRITTVLSNLSQIYLELARYEEAANQYQKILDNNLRQLGPEHLYVGFALGYLSTALIEDGRSEEAMPMLEEALKILHNAVGEDHRFYARGLMMKGDALYYQEPGRAVALLERSVNTFRRVVNHDHPDLARALGRLGRARLGNGEIEAAKEVLQEALGIQRQILPPSHTDTAWTLTLLGRALTQLGHFEEAKKILLEAKNASGKALPANHWRSINARLELAACLIEDGMISTARNEIEQLLRELHGRTDFHGIRLQKHAKTLLELYDS